MFTVEMWSQRGQRWLYVDTSPSYEAAKLVVSDRVKNGGKLHRVRAIQTVLFELGDRSK